MCSAEFLPKCYMVIRKDYNLHIGGVMKILAGGAPPLFVGALCRSQIANPSNESLDGLECMLHHVSTLVSNSKATLTLAGDFNCKDICWDILSILPGNPISSVCDKLIHISTECGLTQLQRQPTRQNSFLDLFFMSNKSLVSSVHTILGISTVSDLDAIMVDTNFRVQNVKASHHKVHLQSKAQWSTIKEESSAF